MHRCRWRYECRRSRHYELQDFKRFFPVSALRYQFSQLYKQNYTNRSQFDTLNIFIINNKLIFARVTTKLIKYILQLYLNIFRYHSQKFSIDRLRSWRRQIHIM